MFDFENSEGYPDPTPISVIRDTEGKERPPFMPLVYICSPYKSDLEANAERTRKFCRFALDQGQIPLAATLMFPQFMDETNPAEMELSIFMGIVLMGKCSEVWVLGDVVTEGMAEEIDRAKRRRQPIRYFNSAFEEVDALCGISLYATAVAGRQNSGSTKL